MGIGKKGFTLVEIIVSLAIIRKMAVLEVDFEANKKFLQENLYGDGDITSTSEASAE